MKTLFFCTIFLCHSFVYGQTRKDTIYYTAKWVRTELPKIVAFYGIKEYDENGKGLATYYHKSGVLHSQQMELKDLKEGLCTWFYSNGNKKSEGNYSNDKPVGDQYLYSEKGALSEINTWENGKVIKSRIFDLETGEEVDLNKYVLEFPDKEADFPGGMTALQKFISENIIYPKEAILNNESGKVYASFIVEPTGEISTIVIERGVSPALNAETIRVIENMPKWIPGQISDGTLVRTRCRLPINYTLTGVGKKSKKRK